MKSLYSFLLTTVFLTACVHVDTPPQNPNQTQSHDLVIKTDEENFTSVFSRNETPAVVIESKLSVESAKSCLETQLKQKFNLPDNFYDSKLFNEDFASVWLVNPYSKKKGIRMDVIPNTTGSKINLYANYSTLSTAWKKLPQNCK